LIEDDDDSATLIAESLRELNLEQRRLKSTDRIIDEASEFAPDLVILDIASQDSEGWDLLQQLRALSPDTFRPILVITADSGAEVKRNALGGGGRDLLVKPFATWELQLRARNLLEARALSERAVRKASQLRALIELQRETISAQPESLYQHALRAAIDNVPGAEAGSLLVRKGDVFHFSAAIGYDLETLSTCVIQADDLQQWHGGGPEEWSRGEPRVMSRDDVSFSDLSTTGEYLPPELQQAGRLDEIATNLYLPVVYTDRVLAVMNLDNMNDPRAFTEQSIEAARIFGPSVAVMLHGSRYRRLLAEAAMTDSLTGIGNRRTFDRALAKQLASSERYGYPFSLVIMDLSNFKRINDELGHGIGDEMLVEVATALGSAQREGDTLARWGGDEFTVLLPSTGIAAAEHTARRYAAMIGEISHGDYRLGVNIGVCSYPKDGKTPQALLAVADRRMYEAKGAGVVLIESPGS